MRRVLFVHGLESGPRGTKSRALEAAGFTVVAGQMPCGRKAIARDPVVIGVFALGLATLVFGAVARGASGFVIAVVTLFVLQRFVRSALMRRVFRRSVAVQVALLKANQVDVVVGSSFGGAVALELLISGAWKGPTVLLCPAHRLVAGRGWTPTPVLPADAQHVLVVHGRQDETVPLEHSRSLVRNTSARLLEVDDDHRLTATANAENFAHWLGLVRGVHTSVA
jgi:pimeloyl-ACP methyl ester carboxylesterase